MTHQCCQSVYASRTAIDIPIPCYPGLTLICTEPERYPPEVINQIRLLVEQCVICANASTAKPGISVDINQVKTVLRALHEPAALNAHPLAVRYYHLDPTRCGSYLAQLVCAAITACEQSFMDYKKDIRGTILRLRYIERNRVKRIIQRLHVSERHYYRLHCSGLHWLAAYLTQHGQLSLTDTERLPPLSDETG